MRFGSIIKDGVDYYSYKNLIPPEIDDYFVVTGEVEFQGGMEDTGYTDAVSFERDKNEYLANLKKYCPNRSGFYCKTQSVNILNV